MQVKVKEVTTYHLYKKENTSSNKIFAGMKVVVKLGDGKIIRFKTDYIIVSPRKVITKVINHVYMRTGLPAGVSELVTLV